jgi:hypothetical protein
MVFGLFSKKKKAVKKKVAKKRVRKITDEEEEKAENTYDDEGMKTYKIEIYGGYVEYVIGGITEEHYLYWSKKTSEELKIHVFDDSVKVDDKFFLGRWHTNNQVEHIHGVWMTSYKIGVYQVESEDINAAEVKSFKFEKLKDYVCKEHVSFPIKNSEKKYLFHGQVEGKKNYWTSFFKLPKEERLELKNFEFYVEEVKDEGDGQGPQKIITGVSYRNNAGIEVGEDNVCDEDENSVGESFSVFLNKNFKE